MANTIVNTQPHDIVNQIHAHRRHREQMNEWSRAQAFTSANQCLCAIQCDIKMRLLSWMLLWVLACCCCCCSKSDLLPMTSHQHGINIYSHWHIIFLLPVDAAKDKLIEYLIAFFSRLQHTKVLLTATVAAAAAATNITATQLLLLWHPYGASSRWWNVQLSFCFRNSFIEIVCCVNAK